MNWEAAATAAGVVVSIGLFLANVYGRLNRVEAREEELRRRLELLELDAVIREG